VIARITKL